MSLLGMGVMTGNERYLGNPLFFSNNKRADFDFLKQKISARIEEWQAKLLSKAGRTTLIKLVALSIPTYTMSSFLVPKSLCEELDAIVRRFWWTGKMGTNRFLALKS